MKKVLVIGEILVEIMADRVDQSFLDAGTWGGPFPSGAPAIFIDQIAKFGVPCAILSGVGEDDFGKLCLDRLAGDGVDVGHVKLVKERATGAAFVRYNGDGSRNFIYHIDNAACGTLTEEDVRALDWEQIGAFHIMGSSIFSREMYRIHKAVLELLPEDCVVTFDPNVRPEILGRDPQLSDLMQEFFGRSELVFATEEELEFLTDGRSFDEALDLCFSKGVKTVVVKRGARGASLYTADLKLDQGPYPKENIDPTGAGDTFAGAFVAGYLKDWPLEKCLSNANIAGAFAVSERGPMSGTITLEEIPE